MIALADALLTVMGVYFAIGVGFGAAFAVWGAQVIDPAARGMPVSARLLVLPGATALWPLLLVKWLCRQQPPVA